MGQNYFRIDSENTSFSNSNIFDIVYCEGVKQNYNMRKVDVKINLN